MKYLTTQAAAHRGLFGHSAPSWTFHLVVNRVQTPVDSNGNEGYSPATIGWAISGQFNSLGSS